MPSTNIALVAGYLASDVDFRRTERNGREFVEARIVVAVNYYAANGIERCRFLPIRMFGPKAEFAAEKALRGDPVIVEGILAAEKDSAGRDALIMIGTKFDLNVRRPTESAKLDENPPEPENIADLYDFSP